MRASPRSLLAVPASFLLLWAAEGRQRETSLAPSAVTIRDTLPLKQALAEVRKQTGVSVTDALGEDAPEVKLNLDRVSFWRAIDSVALAANARAVQSGRDGSVSLQPFSKEDRRPPVSYDGPFRVRVVRITTTRDLDSERGTCVVGLEVTWTPTLLPLFLESQVQKVQAFDAHGRKVRVSDEGSSLAPVDGRFSLPLEITLPGFAREDARIGSLEGKLLAVAPSKMVRFAFDADLAGLSDAAPGGAARRSVVERVTCEAGKIVLGRESWSVQMMLDYPEGNAKLESFQAGSLVANNSLVLHHQDGKRTLRPTSYVIDQVGSRRARVTYHFADRPGSLRGKPADWKPAYTAPARVVEVPFGFSFKNLPLP